MRHYIATISAVIVVVSLMVAGCSSKPRSRHMSRAERLKFLQQHNLDNLPASDVPLEVNERVIAWMDYFSGSGARHFRRYLSRSGRYIPMMRDILKKHGLPQDLVYVALIESGFNVRARSHAAAVGPWQFIRGTGRRYGLRIDAWVDERQDPVKATHAAARYLRDLHREFGHWYLAMAGYNAGEGRVRKAIKHSGSKSFWVHADPKKRYLRAETRDYVPKYIAATIMAKMPTEFGFGEVEKWEPHTYDIVKIPSQTDLDVVATCAGVRKSQIEELNPELRMGATPPGVRNYALRIPKGAEKKFMVAYAKVPKNERIKLVIHRVKRRESLSRIARRYGVSTRKLASANGMSRRARLRTGTELVIPVGAGWQKHAAKLQKQRAKKRGGKITYRVRRGDTVGKIARKYGVKVSQLKRWNGLNKRGFIRTGQRLKIYGSSRGSSGATVASKNATTHRLARGETLGHVAEAYGVSTKQLMAWNGIKNPRRVRAGTKLRIKAPTKKPAAASSSDDTKVAAKSKAAKTVSGSTSHTLAAGQTLGHVAEMYGVRTADIMRWNNITNPRRVRAGTKLAIKGGAQKKAEASSMPTAVAEDEEIVLAANEALEMIEPNAADTAESSVASKKKSAGKTYKIRSGDSLWSIARKHNVSVKDIKKWNGMGKSNKIKPGESIVIKNK